LNRAKADYAFFGFISSRGINLSQTLLSAAVFSTRPRSPK